MNTVRNINAVYFNKYIFNIMVEFGCLNCDCSENYIQDIYLQVPLALAWKP